MHIADIWPRLGADTREWLVAHNGEPLPDDVLSELRFAADGSDDDWLAPVDDDGPVLSDEAVDWVEETANDE